MSAMYIEEGPVHTRPPLHAVPDQTERFGAVVAAKNAVAGAWNRLMTIPRACWGWFVKTLHLEPAMELAGEGAAWGKGMVAKGINAVKSTIGLAASAGLVIATDVGQSILAKGWGLIKGVFGWAGRTVYSGVSWVLNTAHLPGSAPENRVGPKVKAYLDGKVISAVSMFVRAEDKVKGWLAPILDTNSTHMCAVRGVSIGVAARNIAARFLPAPWNLIVGLFTGFFGAKAPTLVVVPTPAPAAEAPADPAEIVVAHTNGATEAATAVVQAEALPRDLARSKEHMEANDAAKVAQKANARSGDPAKRSSASNSG
jgi:hypothetical protein